MGRRRIRDLFAELGNLFEGEERIEADGAGLSASMADHPPEDVANLALGGADLNRFNSLHPRDPGGRFANKAGGSSAGSSNPRDLPGNFDRGTGAARGKLSASDKAVKTLDELLGKNQALKPYRNQILAALRAAKLGQGFHNQFINQIPLTLRGEAKALVARLMSVEGGRVRYQKYEDGSRAPVALMSAPDVDQENPEEYEPPELSSDAADEEFVEGFDLAARDFQIPAAVAAAAKRGIAMRSEKADFGTGAGVATARKLAAGGTADEALVRKINAYFARHGAPSQGESLGDTNTAGGKSALLWGGLAGRRWASGAVAKLSAADELDGIEAEFSDEEAEEFAAGVRPGRRVKWTEGANTAYGKVVSVATSGTVTGSIGGHSMTGTADDPALLITITDENGKPKAPKGTVTHRASGVALLAAGDDDEAADLAWDGSASRYTDEQYRRACLLDTGSGSVKERYKLPVREPGGALSPAGLQAAYAAVQGARGGVKINPGSKNAILKQLKALYAKAGLTWNGPTNLSDEEDDGLGFATRGTPASKGQYTPEQWANATILHTGPRDSMKKEDHAIPVEQPGSHDPDPELMKAAIRALYNSDADQVQKRNAARRLTYMYSRIDDNPPDSLKGLAGQVSRYELSDGEPVERPVSDAAAFSGEESFLLPLVLSQPVDQDAEPVELSGGKKGFWKNLLPIGTAIGYAGRVLKFDNPTIDATIRNFKANATGAGVPFVMVNDKNKHSDAPELARGVISDMRRAEKFLQVLVEPRTKEASTFLSNFPEVGVSAKFHPNYTRDADGQKFGPTILHAAATWRPHIPKLGLWKKVAQMSAGEESVPGLALLSADQEVIDLSGGGYVELGAATGDEDRGAGTRTNSNGNREGSKKMKLKKINGRLMWVAEDGTTAELSAEERQELSAEFSGDGEVSVADLSAQLKEERLGRSKDKIRARADSYIEKGLDPAIVNKQIVPLADFAAENEGAQVDVVDLSTQDGRPVENRRPMKVSDLAWNVADTLLKAEQKAGNTLRFSERGSGDGQGVGEQDESVRIADLADAYAAKHSVTYETALVEVQRGGYKPEGQ